MNNTVSEAIASPNARIFRNSEQDTTRDSINYLPAMIDDILIARSSMDRCSSAPSTSRLSISEKTMTILFFCVSGIDSSVRRAP